MAVAREVIDSSILGHGACVDPAAPTVLRRSPAPRLWRRADGASPLSPNDPAALLITDFSREPAWTIQAETAIDEALLEMACAGTDALLVERLNTVIGLVASKDIQGPRSVEVMRTCGLAARAEVRVVHLMIPWGQVPVLDWRSVAASRVRDIEEWARNTRAAHAFLVEERDGIDFVRGLICRRALERSLRRSL